MIIGIQYQNIYPAQIHQMPNGLTLFESKLSPGAHNQLACRYDVLGAWRIHLI